MRIKYTPLATNIPPEASITNIVMQYFVFIFYKSLLKDNAVITSAYKKYTPEDALGYITLFKRTKNNRMFSIQL